VLKIKAYAVCQAIEIIKEPTNQLMAKVVLLWNEHPSENVGGYHARRCAELLRKKGHEVVIEKVPFTDTIHGKLLAGTPRQAAEAFAQEHVRNLSNRRLIAEYEKKHGAPVFSFHTTPCDAWGEPSNTPPEKFNVWVGSDEGDDRHCSDEIQFYRRNNNYYVELPAVYHEISGIQNRRKRLNEVTNELIGLVGPYRYHQMAEHSPIYHLLVSKIRRPEQKKYLDPAITEKIAAAIDELISNRAGKKQE
jgi:hypothetical protein